MRTDKKKKIIIATVVAVIAIIVIILCVVVIGNNSSKKSAIEPKIDLVNKFAENDKLDISIDNVAYADDYLILEYTVKVNDETEPFFLENYAEKNEFGFNLDRTIKIDGNAVKTKDDYSDQVSYKISDYEAKVYDIVEIKNLPDTFKLEVRFFENDNTVSLSEDEIGEVEETEEIDEDEETLLEDAEEDIDENEENEENSEDRPSAITEDEEIDEAELTNEDIDDEEEYLEEDATEEDYEEAEGYYDGTVEESSYDEEYSEETEAALIGNITTNATKAELIENVTVENIDGSYTSGSLSISKGKVIKTDFQTFVIIESEIRGVSYNSLGNEEIPDISNYKIDIQDSAGNSINVNQTEGYELTDEDGIETEYLDMEDENIRNNLMATVRTIIVLNENDSNEIKIQPYYYNYDFPNDDIEVAMNEKEWVKVEDGTYDATNSNGGKVEITEIEIKDNQVLFHYNKTGFVPKAEAVVLLRNKTKDFNVFYPDIIQLKGINSDENIVGYNIENNTSFAYNYDENFLGDNLENIDDLEFTLIEGLEVIKLGDGFSIGI